MKTPAKMLVCPLAAAFVFLSCDFGTDSGELLNNLAQSSSSSADMSGGTFICTEGMPPECYICVADECYPTDNSGYFAQYGSSSSIDMSDGEWVCTEGIPPECYFIRPSIKEMPVMDSRVVSYAKIESNLDGMTHKFISDKNLLESWFPNVFSKAQNEECNYFAIAYLGSNYSYMTLAYNDYTKYYDLIMIGPGECSIEIVENCNAKCENKYLDDDFRIPNTVCVECMEGRNNK
ncbi:MAG: hypothetical protein LBB36_05825, partial [Fibromonadaceae bacterium]|nr:hypothetical protein [Fibromonadaceae bacterium]